jgi:hypothetical protein
MHEKILFMNYTGLHMPEAQCNQACILILTSCSRYKVPKGLLAAEGVPAPSSRLLGYLKQAWKQARYLAGTDPQKLLERICQLSFAANALVQGGYYAGWGMQQAFLGCAQSLSPTVVGFLKWTPELILGSAAFPCLQVGTPTLHSHLSNAGGCFFPAPCVACTNLTAIRVHCRSRSCCPVQLLLQHPSSSLHLSQSVERTLVFSTAPLLVSFCCVLARSERSPLLMCLLPLLLRAVLW